VAGAGFGARALAFALALAVAGAVVAALAAVAGGVPIAAGVAIGLSALGYGAWLRVARGKIDAYRYLAVLALPFYCWLPIVAFWTTKLGLRFASPFEVAGAWALAALLVTCLWRRGRTLEERARNPLRGILDFAEDEVGQRNSEFPGPATSLAEPHLTGRR
jgi:hypothetical protein